MVLYMGYVDFHLHDRTMPDRPVIPIGQPGVGCPYMKEKYIVCSCIIPQTLFYWETYPLTSDIGLDTKWRKPTFGRSWGPLWLPPLLTSFNATLKTPSSTLVYFSEITLRETSNYLRYVIFHKTHRVLLYQTMQGFTETEMSKFPSLAAHDVKMTTFDATSDKVLSTWYNDRNLIYSQRM